MIRPRKRPFLLKLFMRSGGTFSALSPPRGHCLEACDVSPLLLLFSRWEYRSLALAVACGQGKFDDRQRPPTILDDDGDDRSRARTRWASWLRAAGGSLLPCGQGA